VNQTADTVKLITKNKNKTLVKLEVGVIKTYSDELIALAAKEVGKDISIPGFRKGNVPTDYIVKNMNDKVMKQYGNDLINKTLEYVVKETGWLPLRHQNNINVNWGKPTDEYERTLNISYDTLPEVPEIDLGKITLNTPEEPKFDNALVEEEIKRAQTHFGTFEQVASRPVQEGDFIDAVVVTENGKTSPLYNDQKLPVVKDTIPQWLFDTIVGAKVDEMKEVTTPKDVNYTLQVKGIYTQTPAKINQELLTKVGMESEEKWRDVIKNNITLKLKTQWQINVNQLLQEELMKLGVDLPESLLKTEHNIRLNRHQDAWKKQNNATEIDEKTVKQLEKEALSDARDALKLTFITDYLAKLLEVSLKKEAVEQAMQPHTWRLSQQNLPKKEHDRALAQIRTQVQMQMLNFETMRLASEKTTLKVAKTAKVKAKTTTKKTTTKKEDTKK
jgi:trigger factor